MTSWPSVHQHADPVALDRPHVVQLGQAVPDLLDPRAVLGGLDEDRPGAGVGEDPLDLGRRWRSRRPAPSPRRRTRWRSRAGSTRSGCARSGATRSPASIPAAIRPLATARTSSRNSPAVTSAQPPRPRRENTTDVGVLGAVGDDVVGQVARGRDADLLGGGVLAQRCTSRAGSELHRARYSPTCGSRGPGTVIWTRSPWASLGRPETRVTQPGPAHPAAFDDRTDTWPSRPRPASSSTPPPPR